MSSLVERCLTRRGLTCISSNVLEILVGMPFVELTTAGDGVGVMGADLVADLLLSSLLLLTVAVLTVSSFVITKVDDAGVSFEAFTPLIISGISGLKVKRDETKEESCLPPGAEEVDVEVAERVCGGLGTTTLLFAPEKDEAFCLEVDLVRLREERDSGPTVGVE